MAATIAGAGRVEQRLTFEGTNSSLFFWGGMALMILTALGTFSARPALAEGGSFTVVMTKVECEKEADLPNIGVDGPDMTPSTAADWVASHPTCRLAEDWDFQWANDPTPDPGSNSGAAGSPWTSFGPSNDQGVATVVVPIDPNVAKVWFREVWNDDYIPFTHDKGQGDVDDVSAELYCHDDVWNYDNYDFVRFPEDGETYHCVAWNVAKEAPFVEPILSIAKSNNSFPGTENPGDEVTYTLTVTAPEENQSDVLDVEVTDLPPAGFFFVDGTDEANSNNSAHSGSLELEHAYASPGVWDIGTLKPGETVTLSYTTAISGSQDAGLYKDLAWAKGRSASGKTVLANADKSDPFVGTQVTVDVPPTPPTVTVPTITDTETRTRHEHVTKRVLGAATLPLTGAHMSITALALLSLVGGMGLIIFSRRLEQFKLSEGRKTLFRIALFILGAIAILFSAQLAYAADTSVRMETPEAQVSSPHFKIGFVVLDILDRPVQVRCFSNGSVFQTLALESGGTSGDCVVDSSVMPSDGLYEFQVTATADGETVESEKATVELLSGAPGTPTNYARTSPASCQNLITFTTASDEGKTVKVEIYRSTATSFTADESTKVGEVAIGSGANGSFTDTVPDCDEEYFYAIRAVSAGGLGSGFVGDQNVKVKIKRRTDRDVDIEIIPGPAASGALTVAGTAGAVAGTTAEGETTPTSDTETDLEAGESDGDVLGEMTEDEPSALKRYLDEHPEVAGLLLVILAVLGYFLFQAYLKKKNGTL